MPRIYVAGPMTGLPEFNYPAFNAAAAAWRAAGWDVENPAEHFGGATDRTYREYVEADLPALMACDAIAMLPGWDGKGARGSVWEHTVATMVLGLPALDAEKPVDPKTVDTGAQILVANYDEWREFQRWRQRAETAAAIEPWAPLAQFIEEVLNPQPLTRHPITGALGRWSNG